ncbi:MAG: class I SAM-dependent methyltransferase [Candidatus Baltobacteraceae bacterium]
MSDVEGGRPTFPKHDYDEYPKTLAPDDFWGQVRRTVNGAPIDDRQISMIVAAVREGLLFTPKDGLLDIACGNGALSKEFFNDISSFYGVDSSEYLIQVAQKNFARPPDFTFDRLFIRDMIGEPTANFRVTKALCYGSFSYFSYDDANELIFKLPLKCPNLTKLYIGNIPDLERVRKFYGEADIEAASLARHQSQIGIWRSQSEMMELALSAGWSCEVRLMPNSFYASHYRFDAILSRLVKNN